MTFTVDVPAWLVDNDSVGPPYSVNSSALRFPDTGTEEVLGSNAQPIRVTLYSRDGSGAGVRNIDLPPTPSGTQLVGTDYVTIAYADSAETGSLTGWSPAEPPPTQLPFMIIESSRTVLDGHTFDPIPRGGYAGEIIHPANHDMAYILAGLPANRLWLQTVSSSPYTDIHVAYLAIRFTYDVLSTGGWSVGSMMSQ